MDAYQIALLDHLKQFLQPQRVARLQKGLMQRTRYLAVLLEDVFQPQNASAVLRTMDCTGIQDAHIVENTNCFEVNRDVALGANKWLTLQTYRDQRELMPEREAQARGLPVGSWKEPGEHYIERAMESLRNRGYRIVATSPHKKGKSPETIDLEAGPLVLLFGTELSGLSEKALKGADEYLHIPMVGFTESYNISVSAALVMYTLRNRLERSRVDWSIPEEQRNEILLQWLRRSIRKSGLIEEAFRKAFEGE